MGEVWAAAQHADFGFQKLIALKVLRTKEVHSNAAVMFFDEAKAASSLQHAAIVPTIDLGKDRDILFIAMDLVRGPSLTALLQRLVINKRTMSPAVVSYVGAQIASALDYAHERATFEGRKLKLVHRDVSPHNVLLDLTGNVRLTDFGVARTAIQDHESHVGTVRGKPSYMAPEQVVGGDIDARTDVFSLGIVLYECACLKRLFGRSNPVKSMDAVLKHAPKPLVDLVPGFPLTMGQVIERALKKDPRERYQRASEFAEALADQMKTLEGGATASLELAHLIAENFERDAFELDGRVKEALAIAEAQHANTVRGESEPPEPETKLERTPTRPPKHRTFVGRLGTRAWPTVVATDPLAPEAIEEARTTMFAATTPSSASPRHMGSIPSYEAITPFQNNTGQTFLIQQRRQSSMTMVAVLCSAALLLLAAAFAVVHANRGSAAPPDSARLTATTATTETPLPVKATEAEKLKTAPAMGPTAPADDGVGDAEVQHSKLARKSGAKRNQTLGAPHREEEVHPDKSESSDAAATGDATKQQVVRLLREVKEVDPQAYNQMMPTLSEVDANDVRVLNKLRDRARAILDHRSQ
jgi:serine/threonine protein kinase